MTNAKERPEDHGGRWHVIDGDMGRTIDELVPPALEQGRRLSFGDGIVIHWPDSPLRIAAIGVNDEQTLDRLELRGFYPFIADGAPIDLTLRAIHPWRDGLEAVLATSHACGAAIEFFDTLFPLNRHRYRVGEAYRFRLAALAYNFSIWSRQPIVIDDAPTIARLRRHITKPLEPDGTLHLSTTGLAAMIPSDAAPEDVTITGPILSMSRSDLVGREVHKIRATVIIPPEGDTFDLDVYGTNAALSGELPKVGDDLFASVWLQGYLADTSI